MDVIFSAEPTTGSLSRSLVPVDADVTRGTPRRNDIGTLVAVQIRDGEIFRRHATVVHHELRNESALPVNLVDRDAWFLIAPSDRELVAAIAVEVPPAECVAAGDL